MGYNVSRGYVSCWRCGSHPLISTVAELADVPWQQAKKLVDGVDAVGAAQAVVERRGRLVLPEGLEPLRRAHREYLLRRGFDPAELVGRYQLQCMAQTARLAWRIFIPIQYQGKTVSWTSRSIADAPKMRYISASAEQEMMNHKNLLYAQDLVPGHAVVVVEGPFDAMNIGPGAVGLCGVGYSRAQVAKLAPYLVRAVCFDSEPDAQRRAMKLVNELSAFPGKTLNVQLDAEDPGSASQREVRQLRAAVGL